LRETLRVSTIQQQAKICRLMRVHRQLSTTFVPHFGQHKPSGFDSPLRRSIKLTGL